ncbi:MAG: coenzyme-B sulfoethylthiotransferase subunit gamma [Candidatus Lokiarchaeota archaeon]|nr:coenzyme-B sulfoethylthiotransferase subunit gamma [Candidatus Lokiarchaeota archaeon]
MSDDDFYVGDEKVDLSKFKRKKKKTKKEVKEEDKLAKTEGDYKYQFYPGDGNVANRRRKILNPEARLLRFRDIPDDDIVQLLGHRMPGALYKTVHPPLDELIEEYDPIKDIVKPTPGARAGDRIRFLQMTDSIYRPPFAPWLRARFYFSRLRGIDTVVFSSREILELRERDLEAAAKILFETELFDPARTAARGITVHGHSLRLDEDGLMFDARRRYVRDKETGEVVYIKDMHAYVLDQPISVGRPFSEEELRRYDVSYRWDTEQYKSRTEILSVIGRLQQGRMLAGFRPSLLDEF